MTNPAATQPPSADSGTTTVAVNTAAILGTHDRGTPALLMDLHQAGGDAAVFLGVEPRFSVADALENQAHASVEARIRGAGGRVKSGAW